jgi:hypothetical protein
MGMNSAPVSDCVCDPRGFGTVGNLLDDVTPDDDLPFTLLV